MACRHPGPSGAALAVAVGALTLLGAQASAQPGTTRSAAPPSASAPASPSSAASSSSAAPSGASPGAGPVASVTVRHALVGVVGSPPFVVEDEGRFGGLSVEVWREVARRADIDFELRPVASVAEGLRQTEQGDLDVLVGPISITAERATHVRFTQPYFRAALGILARPEGEFWRRAAPFLSKTFIFGATSLLVVLMAVGALLWFAERKRNPDMFPRAPVRGIGNGLWFALVTMTTVGYGDRVPVTLLGRILAGVWMVIAMITGSSLTAGIATTLTLSQLNHGVVASADDMHGRRVAVVRGTTGEDFANGQGARVMAYATLAEAVEALENERVVGVVHDRPALKYFLKSNPEVDLSLSRSEYQAQGYGFALNPSGPLVGTLNVALLEAAENRYIERLSDEWLGK